MFGKSFAKIGKLLLWIVGIIFAALVSIFLTNWEESDGWFDDPPSFLAFAWLESVRLLASDWVLFPLVFVAGVAVGAMLANVRLGGGSNNAITDSAVEATEMNGIRAWIRRTIDHFEDGPYVLRYQVQIEANVKALSMSTSPLWEDQGAWDARTHFVQTSARILEFLNKHTPLNEGEQNLVNTQINELKDCFGEIEAVFHKRNHTRPWYKKLIP